MDLLNLVARLTLDSGEYESGLNDAESKASSIGSKLGSGVKTLATAGAAAVGAATAATMAFAKSSVETGMTFDTSMAQVAATMGKSMGELQSEVGETDTAFGHFSGNLREYAQYMGANTAFSASQAADALNYMALAGYDTQKSMDMLPSVLNLAAAGGMDLATASDMVTDAQSALGLSLDETSAMVDQMAAASSKSNTSVSQLGEAFLTIGATARSVKGGTTELATVLGVLADNGIKGSEGGTHLRNMLTSLQNPTKDGAAALKSLGVSVYDADGNMRSMIDIVSDMQNGLEGMDQQSRDAMLNGIFNKADLAAANALLGTSKDRFDELASAIEDADGAAQKMADTQLDTLAGDVIKFKSAFEGLQLTVSDALMPALREFVQFGMEGMQQLTEAFREGGLEGAMAALGDVLSEGLNMVFEGLPGFIDAGMQLLGALGQGIIDNLPTLVNAAVQIVTMLVQGLVQAAPMLLNGAVTLVTSLWQALVNNGPQLLSAGQQLLTFIWNGIQTNLPQMINSGMQIVTNIANGFIKSLPQMTTAVGNLVTQAINFLMSNLPQFMEQGTQMLINIANGIINNLPQIVSASTEVIAQIIATIVQNLPQILQKGIEIIGQLAAGLIQAIPNLVGQIPQIIDAIKGAFDGFDWVSIGINILNGIKDGILGAVGSVVEAAKSAGQQIYNGITGFFNIKSPSRKMMWVGQMIDEGLAKGIASYSDTVDDAMKDIGKIVDINANSSTSGIGGTASGIGRNNVTINVYGAQGQDERVLAGIIADIIRDQVVSIGAVA